MRIKTAFTILEMSIVLTVIAIIIGSLVLGNRLIDRANLDSAIADVERFRQATDKFDTKYGSLPGDFALATTYLPASTYTVLNGNGNGIVDTLYGNVMSTETKQYFLHLSVAGLIAGNFDGTFNAASPGVKGGVPISQLTKKNNKAYFVPFNDVSLGLAYASGYNGGATWTAGASTPGQSYYVDQKVDDGNPNTGAVITYDIGGANVCKSGNTYLFSNTTQGTCMTAFAQNKPAINTASTAAAVSCNGSPVGSTRVSSSSVCPSGTTGTILEICNSSGAWVDNYRRTCEATKCGNGRTVGDYFILNLDALYLAGYKLSCAAGGVYSATDTSTLYTLPCIAGMGVQTIVNQAALTGGTLLNCTGGFLVFSSSNNNTEYTISDGSTRYIGDVSSVGYSLTLPTSYYTCTIATQTAILPLTNVGGAAVFRPTSTDCKPIYTGACVAGAIRSISCPPTQSGAHNQICIQSGAWQTTLNTCAPVTCGGEPIGTWRVAKDMNCGQISIYSIGTPIELCDYTAAALAISAEPITGANPKFNAAQWQISAAHCM